MKTATIDNVQSMFRSVREGDVVSFKLQGAKGTSCGTVVSRNVERGRTGGTTLVVETPSGLRFSMCWRDFGGSLRVFHLISTVAPEIPVESPAVDAAPVAELVAELPAAEPVAEPSVTE